MFNLTGYQGVQWKLGLSCKWDLMSVWSCSVSMMRDPRKTGIVRVVAQRDNANCSVINTWPIGLVG